MSPAPRLALELVSRSYGDGPAAVRAVRDVTLSVSAGEVVAVLGPSGSGKSTLLCLMAGLLDPDSGDVRIDGQSLGSLSRRARCALRRERVGFVFQRFNLMRSLTAIENVALALDLAGVGTAEAMGRADEALAAVGLAHRARALPRDLSGGEQQRVAVARALAANPAVILADEPTGNLDSTSGRAVIDLVRDHVRRCEAAAVIVTHDHRIIDAVDRRLWMQDGHLEEATHAHERESHAAAVRGR
jgi:putative ABC transport system ATP-binding protein